MKPFSNIYADLAVRWTVATAKIAVLFGLLLFLLSFCSCSSHRSCTVESSVTEATWASMTVQDSVSTRLESQTSSSGYLDISDLTVIFYPPSEPCVPPDSVEPPSQNAQRKTNNSNRPQPAIINIGHLSAGSSHSATLCLSKDSVGSNSSEQSNDRTSTSSEKRIRDPTTPWPVIVILVFLLLVIGFTGYHLYRSNIFS